MTPKVSVICTTKDAVGTLAATIEGIIAQDMPEWEMIVVDDGSSDLTPLMLRSYSARDRRIRVIPTDGIGRGPALNLAVDSVGTDLVANIDADDVSHPARLRAEHGILTARPDLAMVCSERVLIGAGDVPSWPDSTSMATVSDITRRLMLRNPVDHSSVMIRRELLEQLGGYAADRQRQVDYDLWVRLAASGHRIGKLEAVLTAKRLHSGQSFENRARLRYLASTAAVQWRAIRALGGGPREIAVLAARLGWNLLPGPLRKGLKMRQPA